MREIFVINCAGRLSYDELPAFLLREVVYIML